METEMTRLMIFPDSEEMNLFLAERLRAALEQNPRLLFSIAAGNTSLGLFRKLVAMNQQGTISFAGSRFVAMDEWVGMNEATQGSCGNFLCRNFLRYVDIDLSNVMLVNGRAEELSAECMRIQSYIDANGGIDFLVLGCGMNGHLALNEPNTPVNTHVHITMLDETTVQVGQKYFQEKAELTGGITIGLADIRNARQTYLAIDGAHKQDILRHVVRGPIIPRVPATIFRLMPQGVIVCSRDAAALL